MFTVMISIINGSVIVFHLRAVLRSFSAKEISDQRRPRREEGERKRGGREGRGGGEEGRRGVVAAGVEKGVGRRGNAGGEGVR